ncbi:alpha/beta hydrolase [Streptomyces sp. NPDC090108]|uniref:alpha/beta hydrolase n=1 Tax=Streptomyces sp. NPDC090108 TaxID=3365947 RepID=UPI00380B601A
MCQLGQLVAEVLSFVRRLGAQGCCPGASREKEHPIAASDIVVAGSPGMLVGDAGDLGVGSDHVWSEAAGDDPVPYIGRPFLGGQKWGVQYCEGVPYSAGVIQTIPSDEAFGAHRMEVNMSGHSGYWDEGSVSLENQGRFST